MSRTTTTCHDIDLKYRPTILIWSKIIARAYRKNTKIKDIHLDVSWETIKQLDADPKQCITYIAYHEPVILIALDLEHSQLLIINTYDLDVMSKMKEITHAIATLSMNDPKISHKLAVTIRKLQYM